MLRSITEVSWTKNVVNDYPTTTKSSNILPWLQDILNEHATTPKPSRNTNDLDIRSTTSKPSEATTMNSFWHEWSAAQPTNIHEEKQSLNELDLIRENNWDGQTIPIAHEHTTTKKTSLAPWMVEVQMITQPPQDHIRKITPELERRLQQRKQCLQCPRGCKMC